MLAKRRSISIRACSFGPIQRQISVSAASTHSTCAVVAAYKAGLDGLVDAGVLPDDGPEHVTAVTFVPPERTGQDGLTITLTEVEA